LWGKKWRMRDGVELKVSPLYLWRGE
jgi:hypothetical protein